MEIRVYSSRERGERDGMMGGINKGQWRPKSGRKVVVCNRRLSLVVVGFNVLVAKALTYNTLVKCRQAWQGPAADESSRQSGLDQRNGLSVTDTCVRA
jgi:hypothetical protein